MSTRLTVNAVAGRYGVSESTVLTWIASGELRAFNASKSAKSKKPHWRITEDALTEFESRRSTAPAPTRRASRKEPAVEHFYR